MVYYKISYTCNHLTDLDWLCTKWSVLIVNTTFLRNVGERIVESYYVI